MLLLSVIIFYITFAPAFDDSDVTGPIAQLVRAPDS